MSVNIDDKEIEVEEPTKEGNATQSKEEEAEQFLKDAGLPKITKSERFRDQLLRFLDSLLVQYVGIIVLILVIIDGAFYFFLMVGWHGLCDDPSRTDCEPRNTVWNISVQILNALFTYTSVVSMPWRCVQFLHLTGWSCPKRSNKTGCNIYGIPDDPDIWCYIPVKRRLGIVIILILNCVTQYFNQVTRIVYPDYESSNTSPGSIWVNVFFAASFVCGGIGAGWILYEEGLVRNAYPGKFGPGILDIIKQKVVDYRSGGNKSPSDDDDKIGDQSEQKHGDEDEVEVESNTPTTALKGGKDSYKESLSKVRIHPDPTRNKSRKAVFGGGESRSSLRLFAI